MAVTPRAQHYKQANLIQNGEIDIMSSAVAIPLLPVEKLEEDY